MSAAYIDHLGTADAIRYGELAVPSVGPGRVLVRTEAVVVDPVDILIRSGTYRTSLTFPFIIGRDLVGTVAMMGSAVTRFAPGERVWCNSLGYDGRQGSFAEYASVDQDRLYSLPQGVDSLQAVAILHPAATAFTGLVHHVGGVHPGQIILVGGGAGNVGSSLVQLARAMGVFQGTFVLTVLLPLLPGLHPRMVSDFAGPEPTRQLEPPGFLGLNYGYQTPLATMLAHLLYGTILGTFYRPRLPGRSAPRPSGGSARR